MAQSSISSGRNPKRLKTFETIAHSYLMRDSIGNGGAGNVYLVERDDGREFALKVLNRQSCNDGKKVRRFLREIAFCDQHSDAPMVEVLDQGFRLDGELKQPFYVMPLYKESLRKLMDGREMDRPDILCMILFLLSSLEGFYGGGHVHRDIKPENILFDERGKRLVLADFGIAHIDESMRGLTYQTSPAERLGNFKYAAPEQRIQEGVVSHRTDQFAFGLIINELFTGAIPQGSGYTEIADVSEEFAYLDPVVERMISQNPDDRYEGIAALLTDIEARKRIQGIESKSKEIADHPQEIIEVSIVGKEWVEPDLVFNLNIAPGRDWSEVFRSYTGTTFFSSDGFHLDPQYFAVNDNRIIVPRTRGDRKHLADACEKMPIFIEWANSEFRKRKERERQEAREALVRKREEEIKRRESIADINRFLETI